MVNQERVFDGYFRDPDATQKKVATNVLSLGDLYFRTGDIVSFKWDGFCKYIVFEDRIGDTFRWKGENVSTMVFFLALFHNLIATGSYDVHF